MLKPSEPGELTACNGPVSNCSWTIF